jgi:methyl-accepting chemotaxis protein
MNDTQSNSSLAISLRRAACVAGGLVVLVAALVLVGWRFDIELLKRVLPGLVAMNPATAVAFIICGSSLWLVASSRARGLAQSLAAGAACLGLLKLCGLLLGWTTGVDQLLFGAKLDIDPVYPNRMAPTTAFNFTAIGAALLMVDLETRTRRRRPGQALALAVAFIAFLAIVGYLYGVRKLTGFAAYIPMALHTATAFLLLATGLLFARPQHGLMAIVTSDGTGGAQARQLLPATVLVPVVLGWVRLVGERAGLYTTELGVALFVAANVVFFMALLWWNAAVLARTDAERKSAQEALARTHEELEQRVAHRTRDLTQVLTRVREEVNVLASAAGDILAAATQLAVTATQSAAAVTETTTTVEEVRHTAELSSQKARSVSDSAQKAARVSQGGNKATEESLEGMQRIRQQMGSIADGMVRLSEQTQAISQIIATVDDLAAQSNLLAVNAAIEAAKAGEQGKGFAVVAQEVRSLAEQSKQATNQVRTILHDIQKATSAAVMATEQGHRAVESGVALSAQAGESILALTGGVTEAAQAAMQIAASNQQQSAGIEQVASAMASIKESSAHNVASARQLETSARNLDALGQRMKQLVERYGV